MSTGSECIFVERKPGEWFYVLEDLHAPKNAWDWREHARAYGAFATLDGAIDHLRRNHANPGGWSEVAHARFKTDAVYEKLFAQAPKNMQGMR